VNNADLSSHQKTALEFMIQRENGPIQDAYRLWQPADVDGQPWCV
jgi:SWI/SNF-related matrix-associated actin-dependent regulator of chromatin subfamily A3